MRAGIGGFFGKELDLSKQRGPMHSQAIAFTSGRSCLARILMEVRPPKLWVPFYTCDSVLIPGEVSRTLIEFYEIDKNLEPKELPGRGKDDVVLYINYFGLKEDFALSLMRQAPSRVIIDNTQAFFAELKEKGWAFNSCRKFFGVPDGAYLYAPTRLTPPTRINSDIHTAHLVERSPDNREETYQAFLLSEKNISAENKGMSKMSTEILSSLNYRAIAEKRVKNFSIYDKALRSLNQLSLPLSPGQVPFCYPLLLNKPVDRTQLFSKGIFIPTFWKDCLVRDVPGFTWEKELCERLLPLPIDHRYGEKDCEQVIGVVLEL